jgi:hypothetical protein
MRYKISSAEEQMRYDQKEYEKGLFFFLWKSCSPQLLSIRKEGM